MELNPLNEEIKRDDKGRLVKGSAAIHPEGRPKGKTMKEFAREFLMNKSDDEKREWLAKQTDELIWRMAEGNPHQSQDNHHSGEVGFVPKLFDDQLRSNNSHKQDSILEQED